jgi:hypothetical protein
MEEPITSRAPKRKMAFDAPSGIASIEGVGEFATHGIPSAIRAELFGVGIITVLARATDPHATVAEMIAGTWGRHAAAAKKPLSNWLLAIAIVKADDMARGRKSGGEKITTEIRIHCNAQAAAWVRGLTKEQIEKLKDSKLVKSAHAELVGASGSLDDLLAAVVPPPAVEEQLDEAAD